MFRHLITALTLVTIISAAGCKTAKKTDEATDVGNTSASADENTLGDSDSGKAFGLQTIHFPFDSFTLSGEAKTALKSNADILKSHASAKVQIEGHCDQKGGIQYNIALGEKRASAVKKYLQDMGVAADRITTISYGKERPVDTADSEEAAAKNRRANFAVTSR